MTDKERLEEIKEQYDWTVTTSLQPILEDDDIGWLIQRAELVEKLEGDRKYWCDTYLKQVELSRGQISVLKNRVEYLEDLCKQLIGEEWMYNEGFYETEMSIVTKERNRYKQALEFYADEENYNYHKGTGPFKKIEHDYGEKARQALEESE